VNSPLERGKRSAAPPLGVTLKSGSDHRHQKAAVIADYVFFADPVIIVMRRLERLVEDWTYWIHCAPTQAFINCSIPL
jgi:hypothetical protein